MAILKEKRAKLFIPIISLPSWPHFLSPYPIKVRMTIEGSVFVVFKPINMQKATSSISAHMKLDIVRMFCTIVRMEHAILMRGGVEEKK